jgi:phosphoglucosamine mutase
VTLRFGTDGVRGLANVDLTPELVVALGRAAARTLHADRMVLGRDTRRSGPLLESAFAAGLAAEGVIVELAGVLPTPAVAWVCAADRVSGAVMSASHNPYSDNGIKLFAAGGRKLDDRTEEELEATLDRIVTGAAPAGEPVRGEAVGTVEPAPGHGERWAAAVAATLEGRQLDGLSVLVDAANGAASQLAPPVIESLGASVTVINASPDGTNINAGCGATDPADLQLAVREHGADLGLAFDGDADRVIAVDATGEVVDGDHIIAICAVDRRDRGLLEDDTVVVTVMANLGFRLAMEAHGIQVVQTPVGDRYVLEALLANGWSLGGEQSGHVIFPDLATTGDGLLTGVQLLDVMARSGRSLADLAGVMTALPQVLRNVRVAVPTPDVAERIGGEIRAVETGLAGQGRALVRPSGTEPVVRVMVEAPSSELAEAAADRLVAAVERACRP